MEKDVEFPFPFQPYDIQQDFMKSLYTAIEDEKIGIFESPTGTGKSLSLICGALKWLQDYQEKENAAIQEIITGVPSKEEKATKDMNDNEPNWVEEVTNKIQQQKRVTELQSELEKQKRMKDKLDEIRKKRARQADINGKRKRKGSSDPSKAEEKGENQEDDNDLILNDYQSDGETKPENAETSSESEDEDEEMDHVTKIYYCSRTHSQLTQFVHEVKKSPYGDTVKLIALGSRQNFCINEEVRKLKSIAKINERCLELQKSKKGSGSLTKETKRRKKKTGGCPYNKYQGYRDLKDYALAEVLDIEELVSIGQELEVCPYYGSRHAVPQAQVVILPYNTILHKSTREAVGVKLKGNIVIIDEAHNLMETINNIHSVELTGSQIASSCQQLTQYFDRYRSRLKAKNLVYVNQLLYLLRAFKELIAVSNTSNAQVTAITNISSDPTTANPATTLETINDFLFKAKIDNVNLFKVRRYCERSLIAKKLNGFVDRYRNDRDNAETSSQFLYLEAFLDALTNADKDGRVLVTRHALPSKNSLKFLLLNPAVHFANIVKEARAIIIAGGTMQPVSEVKNVLLYSAGAPSERILEFSCGHVIPPENLVAVSVSKGPSNLELDFTYQNREGFNMIDELGRLLFNVCNVVPGGVVVFFPSYEYEEKVYTRWFQAGMVSKMQIKKRIFREPRQSNLVDQILLSYSRTLKWATKLAGTTEATKQTGAILLSVVGGKMSEGINFSDDLGRCVVMVGLPYPNINSPELREKMEYLNKTLGPNAGKEHYENICMKAVNQSIGRAIRHRDDYACILLADHRFARPSVRSKLPKWIQERLATQERFGPAIGSICKFFVQRKRKSL